MMEDEDEEDEDGDEGGAPVAPGSPVEHPKGFGLGGLLLIGFFWVTPPFPAFSSVLL